MSDRKIVCTSCGLNFVFSEEEQKFFKEKNFDDPRRCPKCRIKRRELSYGKLQSNLSTDKYQTTCSDCGAITSIPFKPDPKRVIYCRACFNQHTLKNRSITPSEGIKVC